MNLCLVPAKINIDNNNKNNNRMNKKKLLLLLAAQLNCFWKSVCVCVVFYLFFVVVCPDAPLLFDFALIWHFCFVLFIYIYIFIIFFFCFNSTLFAHNFSETCVRKQTNAWINSQRTNDNEWMSECVVWKMQKSKTSTQPNKNKEQDQQEPLTGCRINQHDIPIFIWFDLIVWLLLVTIEVQWLIILITTSTNQRCVCFIFLLYKLKNFSHAIAFIIFHKTISIVKASFVCVENASEKLGHIFVI